MTNDRSSRTVSDWVTEKPNRARVFEQFGIDYCCGGRQPLEAAAAKAGHAVQDVLAALAQADTATIEPEVDWTQQSMTALADHIETTHHAYLRDELPRLAQLGDRVVNAHGERHPEVVPCRHVLSALIAELSSHMQKEEQILFPLIRQMEAGTATGPAHCGSVRNPISVMEHEHDIAGDALAQMRAHTHDYTPPADACNTYRAWLDGLLQLELDLHRHIHKENNILFPRAIKFEQTSACV